MTNALDSSTGTGSAVSQPMTQTEGTWSKVESDGARVGDTLISALPDVSKGQVVTVTVKADGTVEFSPGSSTTSG